MTDFEDGEAVQEALPVMPPPESEPEMPEPKRPHPTAAPKRDGLLRVTAKQFAQARGIRWERAAGFLFWAGQKYGAGHRLTVPEWTHVHEAYLNAPVR